MATGGSRKRRAVTQSSRLGENGFNIEYVENARVTDRNGTLSIGPSIDPNKGCLKWFVKAFHRHINQYLSAICWEYFAYPVVTQCGHSFW